MNIVFHEKCAGIHGHGSQASKKGLEIKYKGVFVIFVIFVVVIVTVHSRRYAVSI